MPEDLTHKQAALDRLVMPLGHGVVCYSDGHAMYRIVCDTCHVAAGVAWSTRWRVAADAGWSYREAVVAWKAHLAAKHQTQ